MKYFLWLFSIQFMKILILFLSLFMTTSAFANRFPDFDGFWLTPGFTGSMSKNYTYLGGELSAIYLREDLFYGGAYADVSRSLKKNMRYSAGPEFGFAVFGVDGGYVYQKDDGIVHHGYSIRPYIFIPFYASLCLFYRRIQIKDNGWNGTNEIGFQIKIPIPLSGQH